MSVERDMEKVLAALGQAELPLGFEARLMRGIEAREAGQVGLRTGWMRAALPVAACAAMAVAAGLAWVGMHGHGRAGTEQVPVRAVAVAPAPELVRQPLTNDMSKPSVRGAAAPADHGASTRAVVSETHATSASAAADSEEARALADMRAPSMPERPLGVTAQEKLLLQVARTKDAPALAAESFAAQAERRERLTELGQWLSAGLTQDKQTRQLHEETE